MEDASPEVLEEIHNKFKPIYKQYHTYIMQHMHDNIVYYSEMENTDLPRMGILPFACYVRFILIANGAEPKVENDNFYFEFPPGKYEKFMTRSLDDFMRLTDAYYNEIMSQEYTMYEDRPKDNIATQTEVC